MKKIFCFALTFEQVVIKSGRFFQIVWPAYNMRTLPTCTSFKFAFPQLFLNGILNFGSLCTGCIECLSMCTFITLTKLRRWTTWMQRHTSTPCSDISTFSSSNFICFQKKTWNLWLILLRKSAPDFKRLWGNHFQSKKILYINVRINGKIISKARYVKY